MTNVKDLQSKINYLRNILNNYLDQEEEFDKVFKLNVEIDELIIEYYRLTMKEL